MSRQLRALLGLVLVSFALSAAACSDANATGPKTAACDINNSNTCQPH
ncbi:MAG TPA: hypothetical protein VEU55_09635 [Gemmatimonadales bacterium]|nr:hypothetical protein [Gemmatimonadales bacterium]